MGHSDAALCLEEVLDGSEIGLLFGVFYDWIFLEGIAFSHWNRINYEEAKGIGM